MAAPIAVGAITTCVVFLPMIFMRGMSGVMFKQLAYVVSFANLMGLFVALTMVPMLSARLIRVAKPFDPDTKKPAERLVNFFLGGFRKLENWYKRLLHKALDHRVLVLSAVGALLVGCLFLIRLVGTEFMPATDENEVRVTVEMEVGTRLEVMDKTFATVTEIVKAAVPEIISHEESFGGGGWRSGANTGNMTLKLVPRDTRSRSSEEIAVDLRQKLSDIPGTVVRTRASGGQMMFGMRGGGGQERLQVEIRGYDLTVAEALARQVQEIVKTVKGVTDTRLSREIGNPEELLVIDRQAAADMKLSVSEIGQSIQTVLSGTQASYFREAGREFRILVKVKDSEYLGLQDILDLTVTNADGEPISLRNVIDTRPRRGPIRIERRDRERVVTVSGEIAGRDLGSVIATPGRPCARSPSRGTSASSSPAITRSSRRPTASCSRASSWPSILVYMIMAMLYESLRDPFIVMFSVPLAAIGVILMLFLTKTSFNMQSYIGFIMLGGIVVNNAIIIVDYTNLLRQRDKMPIREAIEEAGRRRLRPILMTAFTAIMATLPAGPGARRGRRGPGTPGPDGHRRAAELDAHHAHRRARRLQHLRGLPAEEGARRHRQRGGRSSGRSRAQIGPRQRRSAREERQSRRIRGGCRDANRTGAAPALAARPALVLEAAAKELALNKGLAVGLIGQYGRFAVPSDLLAWQMALGTMAEPRQGIVVGKNAKGEDQAWVLSRRGRTAGSRTALWPADTFISSSTRRARGR